MKRALPVLTFLCLASTLVLPSVFHGGTSQGDPEAFTVQGFLVARIPLASGEEPGTPLAGIVFVPGVTASLENVGTRTRAASARTDLSGRFVFAGQLPGRYRVCWAGRGFVKACGKAFAVVDHVHLPLSQIIPVKGAGLSTIVGRVRFADGSLPRALDPLAGVNSFARVKVLDAAGRALTPPALVNNYGDYIVPAVRRAQAIVLQAEAESATKRVKLAPAEPFTRAEITLQNTPPESDGILAQASSGTHWTAGPGEDVALTVLGRDPDGDSLSFHWVPSPGAEQVSAEGNRASFRLPRASGEYEFAVVLSDGKGGYARDAITITAGRVHFAGRVTSTNRRAVAAADVDVNGVETTTDKGGHFELLVKESPRYVLTIRHSGYALVSHVYDVARTGGSWMLPRASTVAADPNGPIAARNERIRTDCPSASRASRMCPPGITVRIPAGALVDPNGKRPDGPVEIALATADLGVTDGLPGDQEAATDAGVQRPFVSLGAGFVEVTRNGVHYNLAPGAQAELVIPIARVTKGAADRVQLFSYDEPTGRWAPEGFAERAGNTFVARVRHLSTFTSGLFTSGPSCLRIESTLMPDKFTLGLTWPVILIAPNGRQLQAKVLEGFSVTDNGRQRFHVIPNLPLNTRVEVSAFEAGTNTPIQLLAAGPIPGKPVPQPTLTANTGPNPQSPATPNPPDWPYAACRSAVELSPFTLGVARPNPLVNTFFYGVRAFQAVNLDEVDSLTAGAVKAATARYYETIDPGDNSLHQRGFRTTLDDFKEHNGFASGGVIGAQYANTGDLGFGRDMECRKASSGDVACYVTNYGDRFTDDVTDAIDAKANAVNPGSRAPVATVAMEYSPIESRPGVSPGTTARIVKFYVYNGAGARVGEANLDGFGARPVPALCMVCHGGIFPRQQTTPGQPAFTANDPGSADLDSRFIPFDLRSFTLPAVNVPGVGFFDFKAQQQAVFKALNQNIVAATGIPAEPLEVIQRMYTAPGGQPGVSPNQITSFVTSGWLGGTPRLANVCQQIAHEIATVNGEIRQLQADLHTAAPGDKPGIIGAIKSKRAKLAQLSRDLAACITAHPVPTRQEELYDKVVAASCRTCHLSLAPRTSVSSRSWERALDFSSNYVSIKSLVCGSHVMPHAIQTHNRFWLSANPQQPKLLDQFFLGVPPPPIPPPNCIPP